MEEDKEYNTGELIHIKCKKAITGTFVRLEVKEAGSIALAGPVEIMYRKNANPQYLYSKNYPNRLDWSTFDNSAAMT